VTVEVTGLLQREAWRERRLPPVEQLRPWLWSIPVPMPRSPLRYVLVYALDTAGGLVVLDTGWNTPVAWTALTDGLAGIGASVAAVAGILVTHAHFDHYGLAGRIRAESGAWIALHRAEAAGLRHGLDAAQIRARYRDNLIGTGARPDVAERLAGPADAWRHAAEQPYPDRVFDDGDVLVPDLDLRAVWTPGHTPGHSCFVLPGHRLLLSGDHVLPRISPNISAYAGNVGNDAAGGPLAAYLDSLAAVADLDVDEVLPGHEYRFTGLADRSADLIEHHRLRLDEVLTAVREAPGSTAWEVAQRLTWSRPWHEMGEQQWPHAAGEALSHLQLLAHRGRIAGTAGTPVRWKEQHHG
jgi:glyoxylase-like metal-dependent hydrolase (beta-lactamase superfamily II)